MWCLGDLSSWSAASVTEVHFVRECGSTFRTIRHFVTILAPSDIYSCCKKVLLTFWHLKRIVSSIDTEELRELY